MLLQEAEEIHSRMFCLQAKDLLTFLRDVAAAVPVSAVVPPLMLDGLKALTNGASKLASDAMHAMNGRCAFLHISDHKQRCKLFASQVLPVLSYAREVCAVMKRSAEQLHRQFLKH